MAYMTISLQPPGVQTQQRQFQEKRRKVVDKDSSRLHIRTCCATFARSRAIIRVSLERREHHGPYEVTVAGRSLSQSSIRSGFCGPAVFWAKAQRRHRALALSRKADERKLMFALGRNPTKFASSNKVETPKTPIKLEKVEDKQSLPLHFYSLRSCRSLLLSRGRGGVKLP
jgi:hypothetical protein